MKAIKLFFLALLVSLSTHITAAKDNNPIKMYFATAADSSYFDVLLNLIGSIFSVNYEETDTILVFDLGLDQGQKDILNAIDKVRVEAVEMTHPNLLTPVTVHHSGKVVPGWYAWKPVVIKQALDQFPYILYLDAGTTVIRPLNDIFRHIIYNGYFLIDNGPYTIEWQATKRVINKFQLREPENKWLLDLHAIDGGFQGLSHSLYETYVMPMYELSKDPYYFVDDGTTPDGFGTGRHDQTLFSVYARLLKLTVYHHDYRGTGRLIQLQPSKGKRTPIHITWHANYLRSRTVIIRSQKDIPSYNIPSYTYHMQFLVYKGQTPNNKK